MDEFLDEMAKKLKYKVSVIIPVYNQEKLIERAISSVPDRDDIEIVIVNDGSTDKTLDVVKNYIDTHKLNTCLVDLGKNYGVGTAVNAGFDNALGEYMVLLGSDDHFNTPEFEKALKYLDGTDLVYFNLVVNNGDVWKLTQETKKGLCGSVKFMRRQFVGETRCPYGKKWAEDYDFYQELLKKNPTEVFTDLNVKFYNYPRENSLTQQMFKANKAKK